MFSRVRDIQFYLTEEGESPFEQWLDRLDESATRNRIETGLMQLQSGRLGRCRDVGAGLMQLVVEVGPGYRIYFAQISIVVVLLLCAGDETTEEGDIEAAANFLDDYYTRKRKESIYAKAN